MKNNSWVAPLFLIAFMALPMVNAQTLKNQTPAPDNTKTNKTADSTTTADKQKQNRSDLEITRDIRQLITKDKALSTYAKNVKIVSRNGDVTLSGPVRSDVEKKSVEAKAIQIAGAGHVKNDIQIAPKQSTK